MQLDMPSGASVELPQQPLSLLPFEESSFYVRTVYLRLWNIITRQTGMCAADKCLDTRINYATDTHILQGLPKLQQAACLHS